MATATAGSYAGVHGRAADPVTVQADFETQGVLRIVEALSKDSVARVREHLRRDIDQRFGIRAEQPDTWFANSNQPRGDHRGRRLSGMHSTMRALESAGTLDALETSLLAAVRESLGPTTWTAKPAWHSLLSFPGTTSAWNVPHQTWHADEPVAAGHARPWTVFAFVFLASVEPRGGGATTAVAGSHRCGERLAHTHGRIDPALVEAFADDNQGLVAPDQLRLLGPSDTIGLLARTSPWFEALVSPGSPEERAKQFMERGSSFDGIPVKVVELTGRPGDIVLLDPRCLHSVSVNTSGLPREVLRLDFRRLPD